MSSKEIVPIAYYANAIQYVCPNHSYISNKKIVNEIKNAWNNSCVVDANGQLFIKADNLHSIIRTSRANAKYLIEQTGKDYKRETGGKTFIRGSEVIKIIDERLQTAGKISKEKNLKLSYEFYGAIRDSYQVHVLRDEYYESLSNCVNKLKKSRIKKYKITFDELTNEPLNTRNSEFSHIRSCSIYTNLMDNILNGHVVNKETHTIITSRAINDEKQLLKLCVEMGWNKSWYDDYTKIFCNL